MPMELSIFVQILNGGGLIGFALETVSECGGGGLSGISTTGLGDLCGMKSGVTDDRKIPFRIGHEDFRDIVSSLFFSIRNS